MDLGLGKSNQKVGNATAQALLNLAQAQENVVNDEISRYDNLLDGNDEALVALRQKRLQELQKHANDQKKYRALGHGTYEELAVGQTRDVAKAFFEASKQSEKLVVHFYRDSTDYCALFHKHLTALAPNHLETRFCKINVQDCDQTETGASFLVERLGIHVMPTLLLVKHRHAVHQIRGFDEVRGGENCSTGALAWALSQYQLLDVHDDERDAAEDLGHGLSSIRIQKGRRNRGYEEEEDF